MFGPSSLVTLFALAAGFAPVLARPSHIERDGHDHDHVLAKRLPSDAWYHKDIHPAHALFRRGPTTDGQTYPVVGSPEWRAGYPDPKPDPAKLPQEWVDALNAAIKAGKVPDIAPSTPTGGNPSYGSRNPNSPEICSSTYKCRIDGDLWDAPEGVIGVSFDDGPLPGSSDTLYDFLRENHTPATHFMIGINILNNPTQFIRAFEELGDDIAAHTWTHPYMTTLTNEQLLGEFGWTMEIIHNSTGGRLPKYWRPPYGDSDMRVRAIAKEVFGLTTVIWNQDTEDWSIGQPQGTTAEQVAQSLAKWIEGPKSPGLIILEHELSSQSVSAFINAYPLVQSNGWKPMSVAQLDGQSAYQNAEGDDGTVQVATNVLAFGDTDDSSSSSNSPSPLTNSSASSTVVPSPTPSEPSASGSPIKPSTSGSKTGSSVEPSATAASQQVSSASLMLVYDVRSVFGSLFALLVSALALA